MPVPREELHKAVDRLPNERLKEVLDYLKLLLEKPEDLSPEEWKMVRAGEKEIADGKGISLEDLERELNVSR